MTTCSIIPKYPDDWPLFCKGRVIYDEDENEAWISQAWLGSEGHMPVFEGWTNCILITIGTDIDPFDVSMGDEIYDHEGNVIAQIVGVQ